jgi:hypothetical protein
VVFAVSQGGLRFQAPERLLAGLPEARLWKEVAESADARFLQSIGVRFLDDDNL